MYWLYYFTFIVTLFASTHRISQTYEKNEKGSGQLSVNVAEYVATFQNDFLSSYFFMGLSESPEVLIDLNLKSTKENEKLENTKDHYFMVEHTENVASQFLVICDPSKEVGEIKENGNDLHLKGKKTINSNGFVAAYLCSTGSEAIKIDGKLIFQNPHGYLDSGFFGFLPFQFVLCVGFWVAVCMWLIFMNKWKDTIMFHHKILSLVLCITFVDECLKLMVLIGANSYEDGVGMYVSAFESLFHSFRESGIRYVGMMMAKGWGMANEHVDDSMKLQLACALYFFFSLMDKSEFFFIDMHTEQTLVQKMIIAVLCFFDAIWATFIVNNLRQTYATMIDKRQNAKALFYELFSYIIMGALLVGILLAIICITFLNTTWRQTNWTDSWWYIDGCWRLNFAIVLALFMYLFRPQKGSQYYAQATQLPQHEEFGLDENDMFVKSDNDNVTDNSETAFVPHAEQMEEFGV